MVNKGEYNKRWRRTHILSETIETMPKDYCVLDIFGYFVCLFVVYHIVIANMFMVNKDEY